LQLLLPVFQAAVEVVDGATDAAAVVAVVVEAAVPESYIGGWRTAYLEHLCTYLNEELVVAHVASRE
jgi:hypothetical protein